MPIDDMDRLAVYLNNLENTLVHQDTGVKTRINRVMAHPFIQWDTCISCMLSVVDLKRLSRRFEHPITDKLMKLLERSNIADIGPESRRVLKDIKKDVVHATPMLKNRDVSSSPCERTRISTIRFTPIFFTSRTSQSYTSLMKQHTFNLLAGWRICRLKTYGEHYACAG